MFPGPSIRIPNHRAATLLTYDAWLRGGKKFPLYFYEVELGQQTQDFWPTHYVDISEVAEPKKYEALRQWQKL